MNDGDPEKNFERWKSIVYLSKMYCIILTLRFDQSDSYSNIWFDFTMIVTSNWYRKNTKQNIFHNEKKWSIIFFCWTDPIFLLTNISGIESITIEIEEDDKKYYRKYRSITENHFSIYLSKVNYWGQITIKSLKIFPIFFNSSKIIFSFTYQFLQKIVII